MWTGIDAIFQTNIFIHTHYCMKEVKYPESYVLRQENQN